VFVTLPINTIVFFLLVSHRLEHKTLFVRVCVRMCVCI